MLSLAAAASASATARWAAVMIYPFPEGVKPEGVKRLYLLSLAASASAGEEERVLSVEGADSILGGGARGGLGGVG